MAGERHARVGFRTTPEIKQLLERAAELQGSTLTQFIQDAVVGLACDVMQAQADLNRQQHAEVTEEQAFMRAVVQGMAEVDDKQTLSLAEAKRQLDLDE